MCGLPFNVTTVEPGCNKVLGIFVIPIDAFHVYADIDVAQKTVESTWG